MSRVGNFTHGLYTGQVSFNIVDNRRRWYIISTVLVLISLGSLAFRGLNFGIEFSGGSVITVPSATCTVEEARAAFLGSGVTSEDPIVTITQGSLGRNVNVQTIHLEPQDTKKAQDALASGCKVEVSTITTQVVGASWGEQITHKAVVGLVVFLAAVVLYLSVWFEWRMAVAALIALAHDIIITVGIYALVGFEVTPATVIGVLTILGYSLYDTVVVFDKVKENTKAITSSARMTYGQAANLAVNQTLVRSINTSIVGLLPVASLLFVGSYVLGAGTLKDLALALFVGIAIGTYSSVFVATPVLVDFKNREPSIRALNKRVAQRDASRGSGASGGSSAAGADADDDADQEESTVAAGVAAGSSRAARGPRNQPKRSTGKRRPRGKKR
jgi:preprotein translocase subunit SecF